MQEVSALPNISELFIAQWREGSDRESAFRSLFDAFYRPVFRFFEKRGFSVEESHDLTQETFIRVYQGVGSFRGEAPFEAWLFQIAANTYRNALRHLGAQKRAGRHLSLVEAAGSPDSPDAEVDARVADESASDPLGGVLREERLRALRAAVESLPEQMRKCVMLRVYQELSYQQIAVVLRVSVETVKAHLYQARKQLKTKLAAYYFDEAET